MALFLFPVGAVSISQHLAFAHAGVWLLLTMLTRRTTVALNALAGHMQVALTVLAWHRKLPLQAAPLKLCLIRLPCRLA